MSVFRTDRIQNERNREERVYITETWRTSNYRIFVNEVDIKGPKDKETQSSQLNQWQWGSTDFHLQKEVDYIFKYIIFSIIWYLTPDWKSLTTLLSYVMMLFWMRIFVTIFDCSATNTSFNLYIYTYLKFHSFSIINLNVSTVKPPCPYSQ